MLFVVELEQWAFTLKAVKQTFLVSQPVTSSSYLLVVYRFLERACLFCLILARSFIRTTGSARLAILFICYISFFFPLY